MKILKVHLVNIKRHKDSEFDFDGKTTMILGPNGCGKSTIVESIFYGLFRKLLLPNINDMISDTIQIVDKEKGTVKYTDKAYIEIFIENNGTQYKIKSGLAKTGCSLKLYDSETDTWIEKANKITDMYEYIKNEILHGMTSEYFINTVYTEQMGILNLVSQTETIRQKEFDKLIGIDRFQKIHDGLSVTYSKLNKMVRNDITELYNAKAKAEVDISETELELKSIESKKDSYKVEYEDLKAKSLDSASRLKTLKDSSAYIKSKYIEANDSAIKINSTKELLNAELNKSNELKNSIDIELIKNEAKSLNDKLTTDHANIVTKVSELNNFKLGLLKSKKDRLSDIKDKLALVNQIDFYKEALSETDEIIDKSQKTLNDKTKQLDEMTKTLPGLETESKQLKAKITKCEEKLLQLNTKLNMISLSYSNDNYDYEMVKAYLNGDIDSYTGFENQKTFKCIYCSSEIKKETLIEKLELDKLEYTKLNHAIEETDNELVQLNGELSSITVQIYDINVEVKSCENDIAYAKTTIDESIAKANDIKLKIDSINEKSNGVTLDAKALTSESITLSNEINTLEMSIIPDSFKGYISNSITISKDHNINDINLMISNYATEYDKMNVLNKRISDYELSFQSIERNIASYQTIIDSETKTLNEILKLFPNSGTLELLYSEVVELDEKLQKLEVENQTYESKFKSIDEIIKNLDRSMLPHINRISDLKKEIESIVKKISHNELITKRINMVNVGKAYFKQDGLAKHIRKYYIDKINENMNNYIHLFNFDFIPRLDETAGIENYHRYSGGQKIAIAILVKIIINFILKNPINILILDEPTPYMDAERIDAIKELIENIKNHLQCIIITHEMDFMQIDCNKIMF